MHGGSILGSIILCEKVSTKKKLWDNTHSLNMDIRIVFFIYHL